MPTMLKRFKTTYCLHYTIDIVGTTITFNYIYKSIIENKQKTIKLEDWINSGTSLMAWLPRCKHCVGAGVRGGWG